jgi:type I restriction enzyme, S subunit
MNLSTHRLGELCHMVRGTSPTMKTLAGPYPLVVTAEFRRTANTWQLEGPAVCVPLISSTGHGHAALHRVHYQEGKFALANLLVALLPKDPSICDAKYLYHLLMAKKDELLVPLMLGTANVSLKEKDIAGVSIRLPPLGEQHRIMARIEQLAALIHEARTLRVYATEETEALAASRLSNLFINGAQQGWESGVLGDYVTEDCYGTSEKTSDDDSGTPILRMGNIQNGRLHFQALKYLDLSERERKKLLLKPGDIVVNRTNSAELVGKCAVFEAEGEFSFASYLIRLRLDRERAEPRFITAYINSPLGRAYMMSEKKQMTGQANVNAKKLKALPIALPKLDEQRRIMSELDALEAEVDALKRLQNETAAELDAMLPAILDRAFKGEL